MVEAPGTINALSTPFNSLMTSLQEGDRDARPVVVRVVTGVITASPCLLAVAGTIDCRMDFLLVSFSPAMEQIP